MLSITCVNCRRVAPAKDLDEDSGFPVCRWCDAVFELPSADFDDAREDLPGLKWYGRLSIPPSFSVSALDGDPWNDRENQRREFVMTWPLGHVGMHRFPNLLLSIFLWFSVYIMTTIPSKEEIGLRITFFCAAAIPALPVTYLTLVSFINRTHLSITNGLLRVRHGPLPWADNITLSTDDIQRLYCARKKSQRHSTFYELRAKLRRGDVCPVVSKLNHPTTAIFLQQCIEDALGLE
ncbi:uncharacterized protein SOCEGT47_061680 [Sorangium cellulosum]|uniref:Uncharacterized protein n=1 Tax=Sorangium cellulosum TaxID=56 RepID=A0A4P2Q822_SORCE|nr:hypothetical protein [Sorangium cellulosum]AUX25619.1 uncharacterized protein SOCEGT47_061680 [Sorangium cellulosum]